MDCSARKKILIIESDQDLRTGVSDLLEMEGYGVVSASCYQEALQFLGFPDPPEVILFDCVPPCRSGEEFLQELKKLDQQLSEIPVLMMFSDVTIKRKYAKSCIADFIKKPLDIESFLAAIEKFTQQPSK